MLINGQRIKRMWTLGSRYDNNSIAVELDDGTKYRMRISEVLAMVNDFDFVENKARVHTYLEVAQGKESR